MKVLVVEDERKVGQFVTQALKEQSYTTKLVGTLAAARDALAESPFDVIVLDLGLPDGDGLELLAEWRSVGFNEPVLILSAREMALLELFMQNAGRVLTRTLIAEKVWEASYDMETNLIDVYVRRLRRKLERAEDNPRFKTVRGSGYQMI